MIVRLAFAVIANVDADMLIIDEALAWEMPILQSACVL